MYRDSNPRKETTMRTYIFRYLDNGLRETVHAKNKGDAYNKLYKRGIPFYIVEFIKEV